MGYSVQIWSSTSSASSHRPLRKISPYGVVYQYVAADFLALVVPGIILTYLIGRIPQSNYASNFGLAITCAAAFFALGTNLGLYDTSIIFNRTLLARRALVIATSTFIALVVAAFALKQSESYSRIWFFTWAGTSILVLMAVRVGIGAYHAAGLRAGRYFQRSAVLYTRAVGPQERKEIPGTLEVAGLSIDSIDAVDDRIEAAKVLGVDVITLRCSWEEFPLLAARATAHRSQAIDVAVEVQTPAPNGLLGVRSENGRLIVDLARRPIRGWNAEVKRIEDLVVAFAALALLWPVMLLVALAIRLESPGPVLFRQPRLGFNNVPFELLKFRSMYNGAHDLGAARQTARRDERVTHVGKFIRRTSLDELPQLFNVLRGQMSIVGPRPHALATSAAGKPFQDIVDSYAARHRVLPGMTGWAQVNGLRGAIETPDKIEKRVSYDLFYIENWSIWLDIRTMLMTLRVLADSRNTY
jgi:exopolysaccharide biosynthesis polyprenyl glycosylphosphotransferase